MTYYTEIWKSSGRKRKAKFWESAVIEKKKIVTRKTKERKDEKDAGKTVHKRSTRKIMGIRFFLAGGCENFHNFFVLIEFHSIDETSCWKIDFMTKLSKFYTFVQLFLFFGQFFANS